MRRNRKTFVTGVIALVAVGITSLAQAGADANYEPDPLEPGRHPMIAHDHSEEATASLRASIPLFAVVPEHTLHMIMNSMRADYAWYISPAQVRGKVGVLLFNHGVSEPADQAFRVRVMPLAGRQPTAIAFGMAMTTSQAVQEAVADLNAAGVETIVAVDPASSRHKSLHRQWEYILGLRGQAAYMPVAQVASKARIVMAETVDDSPLVAGILLDYAREQSRDEPREAVVIIAHGPEGEADNGPDLAEVRKLAAQVKARSRFASVAALNIQDDAVPEIRAANVATLRRMVTDARAQGHDVIVVPYLINGGGIQSRLQKDLAGLEYRFQEKGIADHPGFLAWIDQVMRDALAPATGQH